MPWEKAYNETEVLERAMHAFWARGYEATSMSDLVQVMGINRGSIYTAFDGKHELFMQVLRHYDKVHRKKYLERISEQFSARESILAAFEDVAEGMNQKTKPGGCLLVNTALELSPHDPDVRKLVDACFLEMENFFYTRIEIAKDDGDVRQMVDSRETAQALLGLFLGLRVLTRSLPQQGAIHGVIAKAKTLLE